MSTPIERAKLEEAIAKANVGADRMSLGAACVSHAALKTILAAAEAHLATLPKTKMVEVWHVEFWDTSTDEPWVTVCADKVIAEARALAIKDGVATCIRVTGPHQHEVPST